MTPQEQSNIEITSGKLLDPELFPNPIREQAVIRYTVDQEMASTVSLRVFDLLGRHVRTLVDVHQEKGTHEVIWDGANGDGIPVANGVYLFKLQVGERVRIIKGIMNR